MRCAVWPHRKEHAVAGGRDDLIACLVVEDALLPKAAAFAVRTDDGAHPGLVCRVHPHLHRACDRQDGQTWWVEERWGEEAGTSGFAGFAGFAGVISAELCWMR